MDRDFFTTMKTKTLKIAILSLHSSPIGAIGSQNTGGMSVYVRELARELGRCGHRIDIFTRQNAHTNGQVVNLDENVRLIHLSNGHAGPVPKLALYHSVKDYFRALESFQAQDGLCYDLIHSHYWLSGLLGQIAQNRWHVPHIVMFHTLGALKNMVAAGEPEPELRIVSEKRLAKGCHCIVASTAKEREKLMRFYDAAAERIKVVPCGVNLNLFRPLDRLAARRRLGFEADESIVLYVGRFDPLKGLDRLIEALAYLRNHTRLRLVIVGGDGEQSPAYQHLWQLVLKLGLKDRVMFAGRIEHADLPPYYNAANVLVIPSRYESFGMVGLESLACGTPVVTTPVGAIERILREGQTGYVVSDYTPAALAKGIESFLSDAAAATPAPEIVRASVFEFDWSHVASAIMDQYATVLKQQYQEA